MSTIDHPIDVSKDSDDDDTPAPQEHMQGPNSQRATSETAARSCGVSAEDAARSFIGPGAGLFIARSTIGDASIVAAGAAAWTTSGP